jgi:predicted enzyme related to lactoylglutathione lyase
MDGRITGGTPGFSRVIGRAKNQRALALAYNPVRQGAPMINGMHAIIYTKDADTVREFFRKTLKFPHVDAGRGWLIFALPPCEMGVHPADKGSYEMYLMCDDIEKTIAELKKKNVKFPRQIIDAGWGKVTAIELPGGLELGLYEPRHPTAISTSTRKGTARALPRKRKTAAKKLRRRK